MINRVHGNIVALVLGGSLAWLTSAVLAADPGEVRNQADPSFHQFKQHTDHTGLTTSDAAPRHRLEDENIYSPDRYLIGKGQGDLAKGAIVCQRVSELSARTDLAKQIRILVKEHMIDRVRERSSKDTEQDIEVTREEIVQEYLQGVKIVDRQIDDDRKICSATAVMPKSQIQPAPSPDHSEVTPAVVR